jgi:hypothetical protein
MPAKPPKVGDHIRVSMHGDKIVDAIIKAIIANAFSKKAENHAAMVAIHFLYYNFGRIHKTLRVTPAMQAGLADHVWSLEELVLLA